MHKLRTFEALKIYWHKESLKLSVKRKLVESLKSKSNKWLQSNGPTEVVSGILNSLDKDPKNLKILNESNWIVSANLRELINNWKRDSLSKPVLLGPNIEFEKYRSELALFKNRYLLVPAPWVVPVIQSRIDIPIEQIKVWASGVDSNYWRRSRTKRRSVLIYRKNDMTEDIYIVLRFLQNNNIPYKIFEYGKYRQEAYKRFLNKSIAAIWLGGTESQGMALLQAWSMDVPTLVRRKDAYYDPISSVAFSATSAPYLTSATGSFTDSENLREIDIENFLSSLLSFQPREYVVQNFTLEKKIEEALYLIQELSI